MTLGRFILVPSLATEPYLGLLCSPSSDGGELCQEVTLWERICRVDSSIVPSIRRSSPVACDHRSLAEKRSIAAHSRWEKHRGSLQMYEYKSNRMIQARTSSSNLRDVGCQTRDSWVRDMSFSNDNLPDRLTSAFVEQVVCNLQRKSPRYEDFFYQISTLLYLTSAKTYRIIRQIVKMPAISSIYRKYQTNLRTITQRLLDPDKIEETLAEIRSIIDNRIASGQQMNAQFTLGIDAFCFRSFTGCKLGSSSAKSINQIVGSFTARGSVREVTIDEGKTRFSHSFVFLLIPHDYRIPARVLHLAHSQTGSYNAQIAEKAEFIREKAKQMKLRVLCKATDGDPGVSREHTDFFNKHVYNKSANFQKLADKIHNWLFSNPDSIIPIADPLHVFKNLRARIIQHPIFLSPTWEATSLDHIRKVLDLGNALADETQVGKMRDSYVVSLFTLRNVVKLIKAKQFVDAYLLFPFACWMAVIFSQEIDLSFRIFLVEFAFQVIMSWYDEISDLKLSGVNSKAPVHVETTFCEKQYARRILNSLTMFGVVLMFGSENIRMDALGTHLVENSIGIARGTSNDPRYERIIQAYAHAELRKEIAAELGLRIYVSGRVNDGGCKVDPDYQTRRQNLVSKPKHWRVDALLNLWKCACNDATRPVFEGEISAFTDELEMLAAACDRHAYNVNESANSGIMARLVSFSKTQK